ncbi:MAG TPA: hypothetical protein VMU47_20460, partial [Caldimonas sp.]|nr:hypothetical protein [Caldimonas sp.]
MQATTQGSSDVRMQALGQVAAEVVHDFHHTLHLILGHAHLARDLATDREVRRHIDQVMRGVALGQSVTERILAFSRGHAAADSPVAVRKVVQEAL